MPALPESQRRDRSRFLFGRFSRPQNNPVQLQAAVADNTCPGQAVVRSSPAAVPDMVLAGPGRSADLQSWMDYHNSLRWPAEVEGIGWEGKDQRRSVVACKHFEDMSVGERPWNIGG